MMELTQVAVQTVTAPPLVPAGRPIDRRLVAVMMNPETTKNRSTPANPNQRASATPGVCRPNSASSHVRCESTTRRHATPRSACTFW